ncbi:MAG: MltA domain-containing protein, partial [Bdellovibrionota bacterium]|nr:MltA domain-containing protein [Bdellovibrionota bacterium]
MKIIFMTSMMLVLNASLFAQVNIELDATKSFKPPVKKVEQEQWPKFSDDLFGQEMQLALFRQIKKFKTKKLSQSIFFDKNKYSSKIIPASILAFQKFFNEWKDCLENSETKKVFCRDQFNQRLKANFNLYRPKDQSPSKGSLFTAYYTPTIEAKLHPEGEYQWGIYRRPREDKLLDLDRIDIDFKKKLQFSAYDLVYTKDLFDNYVLQIQGGGRLKIINENGIHYQYISYEGTNGKKWRYISQYMKKKGYIKNLSNASQKRFLNANP